MKKLINTLVLTYKHGQSMRMTGEARPSETEAAEKSQFSVSVIPVEESKKEEKTLMLSSALAEWIVDSQEVEKNSDKKGVEKKDEQDVTEIQEEIQISGSGERVEKKGVRTAFDIDASGEEVKLGEKVEHEQDVTEALLVLEQIQMEEKTSLEDVKGAELKQDVSEE